MPRTQPQVAEAPTGGPARTRIVAGARRHFLAHGFRGVTMDDLAAELGMSKKTLYAHFRSKPELVAAVLDAKFGELDTELQAVEAEYPDDFPAALGGLLAILQKHAAEVQPAFVRDVQRDAPELFQTVEARRAALIQRYFGKLFATGRRAGMVRKDVPDHLVIEILLVAVRSIVNPQRLGELGLAPQAALSAIISVVLNGVLTLAGRKNR
jgi:AcrR family transcriptional regulator